MSFRVQVAKVASAYSRKGSKPNRRQQVRRMLRFALFCERTGLRQAGQLGERHVINYWIELRKQKLADATIYFHYLAVKMLYRLLDRPDPPPKPRHLLKKASANDEV